MATAKKPTPKKLTEAQRNAMRATFEKPGVGKSATNKSAASHQKDLAKISGTTAAIKAGKKLPKAGRNERVAGKNATVTLSAAKKAESKTLKSFGKSK